MFLKVKTRLNIYLLRIALHSRSLAGVAQNFTPIISPQIYNNIFKYQQKYEN
jgi:hypothetical protein|nr:MAG TPA: hypothetical protein [Caudoviricetes sp.]DAI50211.1 MAG TPA: hypothetical protein [Caudoviricetes sp.]DAK73086.1 MAG TPA: hypothetical protein [Caudoviricetes sp.]DAN52561.1 MAG TPA: hypothetical protein [Caudoviricetes sp.]DAR83945.1 MAG TPA: hypothetical protein [Caudoviricetes sp.]